MKNITIAIEDDIYRKARIKAAEQDTSISALVKNYLVRLTACTDAAATSEFERLAAREREMRAALLEAGKGLRSADNVSREKLHDRDALR